MRFVLFAKALVLCGRSELILGVRLRTSVTGIERMGLRIAGRIRRKRSAGNGFRVAIRLGQLRLRAYSRRAVHCS